MPSGKPVTNFNVASNEKYTNENGETVKITTWFRCTSWGKPAEIHNRFLHKGSKVLIEGRLRPDPKIGRPEIWTRADGTPAADYNVTIRELYFLDSKPAGQAEQPASTVDDDSDYPY
jgi:single-strand DNA-binding protein